MPVFFSPDGNAEVWAHKPQGYFTPEEWQAAHPPVCPASPGPTQAELFARLRFERDRRLAGTDPAMLPDFPGSDENRPAMLAYRQALRDLPAKEGAPWDGGGEGTPWPGPACAPARTAACGLSLENSGSAACA